MTASNNKLRVLFVCTGNICRSPLAEGVFDDLVRKAGLSDRFYIDSAGTSSYHIGDTPDQRTCAVASARGLELRSRARQFSRSDLEQFDYIMVMDEDNLEHVQRMAAKIRPKGHIQRLREFDPEGNGELDVPDPYYGGKRGFEHVHDIVERSCSSLLQHLKQKHKL